MPASAVGVAVLIDEAADLTALETSIDDDDFALDIRVVESMVPITKLMCATSDGCGSSCCSSACTTRAADPFSF